MRELIVSILGEYQPSLSPSGEVLGGLYSLDFTWLCGAFLFCMSLFCLYKILGGLLCRL